MRFLKLSIGICALFRLFTEAGLNYLCEMKMEWARRCLVQKARRNGKQRVIGVWGYLFRHSCG